MLMQQHVRNSMQRSKTCLDVFHHKNNYELDPEFSEEIARFAEEKRKYILEQDEDAWREAIRVQLEEELDQRVRDALNSPSDQESNHRYETTSAQQRQLEKIERLNTSLTYDLTADKDRYSKNRWKIIQAERKLRKFMQHAKPPEATELTPGDYVLNSDLLHYDGRNSPQQQDSGSALFGNVPNGIKSHSHYANVAKKAERNFGSLSTVERFELFYAFTKSGFKEAMRLGRLPDGSELKKTDNGKYKDRYGIIRDEDGPFWPHENGPLFAAPKVIRNGYPKVEPVFESNIENFKQTCDNQPTKYTQKWRGVQIIYDSEKSGRLYEAPPVSEHHAPSLLFESRFESGNLRQARRIGQFEYELVLKTDLYTQRHTQWYYFQIRKPLPGVTYKFKIVNLLKKTSLYNYGMRPLLYSDTLARTKNVGWVRSGHHISYYKNEHNLQCPLLVRDRTHYVLEWQMEFPNADDTYYVAHCYPYTFTDLKDDLEAFASDPERASVMKREVMCETRAGNSCFLISVTNFDDPIEKSQDKKGVVVTARVHPGETNSSWMMRGLLEFITGKNPCAKELRSRFIFKIVPMLNPDGVIVGNYRCSLAGRDLNRNYRHPRKENFPTIWHTKAMLEDFGQWSDVIVYCDLHGHSRKQNVFMYGCNHGDNKQFFANGAPFTPTETFLKERLFPWLMAQKAPDKFSFRGCRFAVRKCKEATGRVVMFKQLNIINSFTMEATFCGTNICRGERRHFNTRDFEHMGRTFCEVVLDYANTQNNKQKQNELVLDMSRAVAQQVLESRGLLPADLPDFTTDKGREQLKAMEQEGGNLDSVTPEYCKGRKGLSASEQYAFAFMHLVKKERDNITKCATELIANNNIKAQTSNNNHVQLSKMNLERLLDMMSGENSDNYLEVLDTLSVNDDELGSESSSDSDSESEPEMVYSEPRLRRKKKKHKRNKGGGKGDPSTGSSKKDGKKKSKEDRPNSTSALPNISSKIDSGKKGSDQGQQSKKGYSTKDFAKSFPGFVNKYIGRSNGGIPCFAEERLLARASKRMEEMKKRMDEDQMIKRDPLYYQPDPLEGNGDDSMFQHPNRRLSFPQQVPKSLTALDLRSQLQHALERGMVRTGYVHAARSPTACNDHHTDSSDDSDTENELGELHAARHSVAAINSPYGKMSPNGQQMPYVSNQGSQRILTAQNQHINTMPFKLSRLPPLPQRADTSHSADSCSIPLRHTNTDMTITPRSSNISDKLTDVIATGNTVGGNNRRSGIGLPRDTHPNRSPHIPMAPTISRQPSMASTQPEYSSSVLLNHIKNHQKAMTSMQLGGPNMITRRKHTEPRHATCE